MLLSSLLWKTFSPLKNSQIPQSLVSGYTSALECSSTFLIPHEKFLPLSALFASNFQIHRLSPGRETLVSFGSQRLLENIFESFQRSERGQRRHVLYFSVSDFSRVKSWSTPGFRETSASRHCGVNRFCKRTIIFNYTLNIS